MCGSPTQLMWVMPSELLRWLLLALGAGLSGSVLALSLWQPLQSESRSVAAVLLLLALAMHVGMAVGFKVCVCVCATCASIRTILQQHHSVSPLFTQFFYFNSALSPEAPTNSTPSVNITA